MFYYDKFLKIYLKFADTIVANYLLQKKHIEKDHSKPPYKSTAKEEDYEEL